MFQFAVGRKVPPRAAPHAVMTQATVRFVFQSQKKPVADRLIRQNSLAAPAWKKDVLVQSGDFNCGIGEVTVRYVPSSLPNNKKSSSFQREILVGLGKPGQLSWSGLSKATLALYKKLSKMQRLRHVHLFLPVLPGNLRAVVFTPACNLSRCFNTEEHSATPYSIEKTAHLLSRWLTIFNYKFSKKTSAAGSQRTGPICFSMIPPAQSRYSAIALTAAIHEGVIVGKAVNAAKQLGNERPPISCPSHYALFAKSLCRQSQGKCRIRHEIVGKDLEKKGLRLFYAVGQGSIRKPRLVVMEYLGNPKVSTSVALVGKGVTFDSGGMNVKPYGNMETMHLDMMGAGAVLGAMQAVTQLKLKLNVVAAVGLAENAIGPEAYYPSSIIRSLSGQTVEVLNTDAEGRLVLADTLTFIQRSANRLQTRPTEIIDLATLTGAMLISLGSNRAGMFCNDALMVKNLYDSGEESLEPVWPLPIGPEHVEKVKGKMSDVINTGGREAGSATAAAFLQHFVEKGMKWAHLDIAGPGMNDKLNGSEPGGAPGFGVLLLVDYLTKKQK